MAISASSVDELFHQFMNVIKLIRNKCTRHNCHSCKGAMQTSLGPSACVNSHMEEAHMVEE